jgi:hypothetical protein
MDGRCYEQAATMLQRASAVVRDDATAAANRLRLLIRQAQGLLTAKQAVAAGRVPAAIDALVPLVRDVQSHVTARAVVMLARLIMERPDTPIWPELESQLLQLRNAGSGAADELLFERGLAATGPAASLQEVLGRLQSAGPTQLTIRRQLQVLRTLLAGNRLIEAQLLLVSIERDVGEQLIDLGSREQFLVLGVELWRRRVAAGHDTYRENLAAYEAALTAIRKVIG